MHAQAVSRQIGVMEWSAPPLGEWRPAIQEERHMTQPAIVGIDLGKHWFHLSAWMARARSSSARLPTNNNMAEIAMLRRSP
jgi:hypothetical protein